MNKKLSILSVILLLPISVANANTQQELEQQLSEIQKQKQLENNTSAYLKIALESQMSLIQFKLSQEGLKASVDQNKIIEYKNSQDYPLYLQSLSPLFIKLTEKTFKPDDIFNNKPLLIAISGLMIIFMKDIKTNLQNDTPECRHILAQSALTGLELINHLRDDSTKLAQKILSEKEQEIYKQLADLQEQKANSEPKAAE